MKGSKYKKESTGLCHFCDYYNWKCRKNKKCNWYKIQVKKFKRMAKDVLLLNKGE